MTGDVALDADPKYDDDPDSGLAILCSRPGGCIIRFDYRAWTGLGNLAQANARMLTQSGCRGLCTKVLNVEALPNGTTHEEWAQ